MALPPSRLKRFLFAIIPAALLLLLLGGVEMVLRFWSPGRELSLTGTATYDGIRWHEVNRSYLKKYFPVNTPIVPEFKPALFRQEKNPHTFRVFCLGESSMFGTPYEMTANIPGLVRKQLRHLHPDWEFEVINLGASAINSNVIVDLAAVLPSYKPDLVLLYAGHNEFYGPDGVGASLLERWIPALTRLKYRLRELRLVQLIESWLVKSGGPRTGEETSNLMRQVSEGSYVRPGSSDAARVLRNFERNLTRIVSMLRNEGIPLVVSNVASNLMFPPFASDSVDGLPGDEGVIGGAIAAFKRGAAEEARSGLAMVLEHDSLNASANYWMGRTLLSDGNEALAKGFLERARDNDLLKFRAPRDVNMIIRRVCMLTGTPLVSADSLLSSMSVQGIPGDTMFWEHLHPTVRGYYEIACMFVREIDGLHLINKQEGITASALLPFQMDSLSVCWLDLAYADLSIQHLTGRWPFQNYKRGAAVLDSSEPAIVQIARDTYNRKLRWDDGCYKSASYFWSKGLHRQARTTYEALLEEYPYNFYPEYLLGSLLSHTGHSQESIPHYERSIASNPVYPQSRLDLGLIRVNGGEFDEGIRELKRVLDLAGTRGPSDLRAQALYGLAAAYANKGEFQTALSSVDQALSMIPGYADALRLRSSILRATGR